MKFEYEINTAVGVALLLASARIRVEIVSEALGSGLGVALRWVDVNAEGM